VNNFKMTTPITFTEPEQAMLFAILKQVGIGSLDNKKLAEDLGISDKNLLKGRLFRFRAKIAKLNGEARSTSSSPTKPPTTPKGGRKSKAATGKKRKLETSDEEDDMSIKDKDEDIDLRSGVGELNRSFFETPRRTMPGRKARTMSFKEEEDEPEEIDDEFQDSGHGGTEADASEQSARVSTSDEEI